jgi:hypothetical protein
MQSFFIGQSHPKRQLVPGAKVLVDPKFGVDREFPIMKDSR